MEENLLTLQEAAIFLKKSETSIYRLVSSGKLRCYGLRNQPKLFSMKAHLLPFLESVQTPESVKPAAAEIKHKTRRKKRSYVFQTDVFDELLH